MTTTTTLDFQANVDERAENVSRERDPISGSFSGMLRAFFKNVEHCALTSLCDASGLKRILEQLKLNSQNHGGGELKQPEASLLLAAELLVELAVCGHKMEGERALALAMLTFLEVYQSWKSAQKFMLLLGAAAAHMKTTEDNLRPHLEMLFFPHLQVNLPEHISESTPRLAGKPGLAQLCLLANDMQQITSRPVDAWARTVFDQASGVTLMGSRLLVLRDELHAQPRFCVQQWLAYLQSSALSSVYAEHGLALQLNIEQGLASLMPIPGHPNAECETFPIMVMPFHLANKTPWLTSMQSCKGLLPLGSNIAG